MGLPTVASMCASLQGELAPANGFTPPELEITAVHVSELADPTHYLSGGELLLTTGLSLSDNEIACDRYVSRLMAAGLSALGIGLGPSISAIPAALPTACRRHGLCLLVVPPATPFLKVTKAYWTARSRSAQQELSNAITAHQSLVNAMVTADPVGETLKALSRAIGGWVARLDPEGAVEHVFPSARITDALSTAEQISSLRVAGTHASATFPNGDEVVVLFPLALEERIVGYIAVGSAGPLRATARRLVLTAGALLSLDTVDRQRAEADRQLQMQSVSTLLDMGMVEPARRLLSRFGLPAFSDSLRLLVVRSAHTADVAKAVHAWMPQAMPGPFETGTSWFIVPEPASPTGRLATVLLRADAQSAAVLSDPFKPDALHRVRVGLTQRVDALPVGLTSAPTATPPDSEQVHDMVQRVLEYRRADLIDTFVAYLRHRGQWDATAREVGVHRNTVRHRVATIRTLLGTDLDDPDVAASLWIHLRRNGIA